jgi:hypothetical protein
VRETALGPLANRPRVDIAPDMNRFLVPMLLLVVLSWTGKSIAA